MRAETIGRRQDGSRIDRVNSSDRIATRATLLASCTRGSLPFFLSIALNDLQPWMFELIARCSELRGGFTQEGLHLFRECQFPDCRRF